MPGFDATTQIFNQMDKVATQFVASNLSTIITTVTPLVALGLTIALTVEGVFLMIRADGEPLSTLMNKFIRWGIIISIASAGGFYQTQLANVALKTPDEFASVLIVNGQKGNQQTQIASVIDQAIDNGLTTAKQAFTHASFFTGAGIASALLGVAVLVSTIFMCGLGAGFILMAKFLLAVTVCFGPIFIFCLLFDSLRSLFTKWMGTIINFSLVTILLSAVFGLMMSFYQAAIQAAAADNPATPILTPIVTCGLLAVVSWFVLKQIPDMAARWGEGVTANVLSHISKGGGGASAGGAGGAAGAGAGGGGSSAGAGAGAGGAAAGAAGVAVGAASAAANEVGGAMQGMARGSRR